MKTSLEIRWFWRDAPPDGLREWFLDDAVHGMPAGGGGVRVDLYLADPEQTELGLKLRGEMGEAAGAAGAGDSGAGGAAGRGPVEVKGLVAGEYGSVDRGGFEGPLELWTKWKSDSLSLDGARLTRTAKRRWLRKFAATSGGASELELDAEEDVVHGSGPDVGCGVELTEVTVEAGVWWTLCFEAFGPLDTLERSVRSAAAALAARRPPALGDGLRASYPEWLARL